MSYYNWGNASDVTQRYHDEEWGMPVHCLRYAVVNAVTKAIRKRRNREQGVVNFGK